jgi:hypothetical protein
MCERSMGGEDSEYIRIAAVRPLKSCRAQKDTRCSQGSLDAVLALRSGR